MDSLASTAIYLASSLTAGPAPATPPVAIVPTVIVAPAMGPVMGPVMGDVEVSPADSRAEANPFAAARARGGKSLSEAIADVVRRDAVEGSSIDAGTGLSLDPERPQDDESLSDDITAAHDARIAFIRQRMDELRPRGAPAAPRLEQLNAKLRLAMAARCLAVAREASEHLLRHADSAAAGACLPAPLAVAADAAPARRRPGHDRSRPPSAHHRTAVDMAGASVPPPPPGATAATSGRPSSKGVASKGVASNRRGPSRRVSAGDPASASALASTSTIHPMRGATRHPADVAGASDRARRLLATARHLLEDASHHSHSDVRLAGLLHWQGSDTWSLADCARSTA